MSTMTIEPLTVADIYDIETEIDTRAQQCRPARMERVRTAKGLVNAHFYEQDWVLDQAVDRMIDELIA